MSDNRKREYTRIAFVKMTFEATLKNQMDVIIENKKVKNKLDEI